MQDAQAQNDASSSNDNDDDGSLNTPQVLPPDFRIADADEAEMLELWSSLRKFLSSGNLGEDEVRRLQSDLRRLSISSNDSIRTQAAEALRRLSVSTELGTAGGAGAAAQAAGEEDDLDKIQEPTSGNSSTSGDLGAAAAMPHVPPSGVNPLPFGSTGIHVPQGCQ
ncbi:MAG: hypothetical protein JKY15_07230 [Deltaproteobacteria bacterium]|nr:hypothetical protein [Deltaproteobacteria bacterium]